MEKWRFFLFAFNWKKALESCPLGIRRGLYKARHHPYKSRTTTRVPISSGQCQAAHLGAGPCQVVPRPPVSRWVGLHTADAVTHASTDALRTTIQTLHGVEQSPVCMYQHIHATTETIRDDLSISFAKIQERGDGWHVYWMPVVDAALSYVRDDNRSSWTFRRIW